MTSENDSELYETSEYDLRAAESSQALDTMTQLLRMIDGKTEQEKTEIAMQMKLVADKIRGEIK